jgi:hypothetical protein
MWKVGCSLELRLKHMGIHVSNNEECVSSDHSTIVCTYCICHCRGSFPSKMWRVTHQQMFLWESVPLFIVASLKANFKIVTKIGFKQEVWSNFSHIPERSCILKWKNSMNTIKVWLWSTSSRAANSKTHHYYAHDVAVQAHTNYCFTLSNGSCHTKGAKG